MIGTFCFDLIVLHIRLKDNLHVYRSSNLGYFNFYDILNPIIGLSKFGVSKSGKRGDTHPRKVLVSWCKIFVDEWKPANCTNVCLFFFLVFLFFVFFNVFLDIFSHF